MTTPDSGPPLPGESLLAAVFDAAGVALCLAGPDLRVLRASPTWLRNAGLTADQAAGRSLPDLFPQDADRIREAHARARAGGRVAAPRHRTVIHGEEEWWEGVITAAPLPQGMGTLIWEHHVTEQAAAEPAQERPTAEQGGPLTAQTALTTGGLTAVFEALADPVIIYDLHGNIVRLNAAAKEVYGFDATGRARDHIRAYRMLRHPDGRPVERDDLPSLRAARGEHVRNAEFLFTNAAGEGRIIVASATPLVVNGSIQGAVASWHDVTDERRLLEQVQRERAFLRTVLEQMPAGVIIVEAPSGRPVMANAQVEQLWRMDFAGGAGFTSGGRYRAFHPDGRPFAPDDWPLARVIQHSETISSEEIMVARGDGSPAVFQVSAGPVRDAQGVIVAAVASFVDVTERKQTENALRESEERLQRLLASEQEARSRAERFSEQLRQLIEAAHAFTEASLDQREALETVCGRVAALFGDTCVVRLVSEDGQSLTPVAVGHPDPAIRELAQALLTAEPQALTEPPHADIVASGEPGLIMVASQQGLREHVALVYHPLLDRLEVRSIAIVPLRVRGRVIGTVSASRYAPRPAHTQDELLFLQALADHAALAVDNARLFREAQEAVRVRDEFLESAAHDLKNPLTAMKGLAQLLQRRAARIAMPAGERERLQEGLVGIEVNVTRMAAQLEEFIDVARLQMGESLTLHHQQTDLVALAYQTAAVHQQAAERQRLWVHAAVPELSGWWDAVRLGRVLDNLISNALKYSGAGKEVRLTLDRETGADGDWAVLRVEDHGVGIPADDLPAVFERFHRARNVSGRVAGTGLGLAGSRQIIEQHGGVINVESTEGVGTVVTVRLPLAQAGA